MTNKHINIDRAVKLVNDRSTTMDDLCKFIYKEIEKYQKEREKYHLEQLKIEHGDSDQRFEKEFISEQANKIEKKIQKEVKTFSLNYAKKSIDVVLDAINLKRFKTKTGPRNLLILLTTLQETNE